MEDDQNGRQPMDQNRRRPKWKMNKAEDKQMKDNQNGRQLK